MLEHRGINRLGYVRLAVPDLDAARQFATKTLGLLEYLPRDREDDRCYLRCWHEPYAFSYVLERGAPGLVEIGLQVRDEDDLDRSRERVIASGTPVLTDGPRQPLAALGESFTFVIPDGPCVRIFEEQDTPGYAVGGFAPDWNPPHRLRSTPAPHYLTHVAFTTPNPAGAEAFLTAVLGFAVSERITTDDGVTTLSSLLFRTTNGHDVAIFPGEAVRLHHVAFAKEDEVDILRDGSLLRQEGVEIDIFGPTRQSYGRTFSLHFFDPVGIRLELCSGGRFSELHPQFRPVLWTESHLDRALSFYDDVENKSFLLPSL